MPQLVSELIARLKDNISAPANKAGAALDRLKRRAGTAGSAGLFGRMNESANRVSKDLLMLGGAAGAAGFAVKSYKDFAQFDRQMTRIGITAESSAGEVANAKKQVRDIANRYGLETADTVRGLDSLTAAGRNMKDALAFLPSVAATAQASGADVADMAASADALGANLKVSAGEMQTAFDILASAGKSGKFELKDMAQFLPSIAAMANSVGLKGLDGTRRVAAMLQVIRTQTGTAGEAATALENVFAKMGSDETNKKFKKAGINLRVEMDKAKKSGKDMLTTFLDLSEKALKGDMSKIPQLFNDLQMAQGMRALLSQRQMLRDMEGQLKNVAGTVAGDLAKVQNDAMSGLNKLKNATDTTFQAVGNAMASSGATQAISSFATDIDRLAEKIEQTRKNFEKLGALGGLWQSVKDDFHQTPEAADASDKTELGAGPMTPEAVDAKRRERAYSEFIKKIDQKRADKLPVSATEDRHYVEAQKRLTDARATAAAENDKWWKGRRGDLTKNIADRDAAAFRKANPGYQEARPAGNMRKEDYKGAAGPVPYTAPPSAMPARPVTPTPPTALPPPVAPQVDASQVSAATQQVNDLHARLSETNGISATVNVNPGGMPGVISDLERIMSMINRINNSSLRSPYIDRQHVGYFDKTVD